MLRPSLRRITSSGRYLPEVDGLRFLCIVPVVVIHLVLALDPSGDAPWRSTRLFRLLGLGPARLAARLRGERAVARP